jgi:hypothetical protein
MMDPRRHKILGPVLAKRMVKNRSFRLYNCQVCQFRWGRRFECIESICTGTRTRWPGKLMELRR